MIRSSPFPFFAGDTPLAGRIHRSTDDPFARRPAVIVSGSWLTVKEQMADGYAAALAARGYTAVTFDFAGWGRSGGHPRHAEVPARKISDITAVARAVAALSFVTPGAVGYLAVCASAQYALPAIAAGAPIAAFASVAGWFHDTASVAPFYGGPEGVELRLTRAEEALAAFQRDGEVRTVPAYAPGDDRAGMSFELDYYASPTRGAVPAWDNEMAELSWLSWLTFDGISAASAVSTPSLFVHSDECVLPDNVRRVAGALTGPVELVWGTGSQIDFYDQEPQMRLALDAADKHFGAHLPS